MTDQNLTSGKAAEIVTEESLPSSGKRYAAYRIGRILHGLKMICEKSGHAPVGCFDEIEDFLGILRVDVTEVLAPLDADNIRHSITQRLGEWQELLFSEWFHDMVSSCRDEPDRAAYDPFGYTVRLTLQPLRLLRQEILACLTATPHLVTYIQLGEAVGELFGPTTSDDQCAQATTQNVNGVATQQKGGEITEICPSDVDEGSNGELCRSPLGMPHSLSTVRAQSAIELLPEQPFRFEDRLASVRQLAQQLDLVLFMDHDVLADGDALEGFDDTIHAAIDDLDVMVRPETLCGDVSVRRKKPGRPKNPKIAPRNRAMLADSEAGMCLADIAEKYKLRSRDTVRKGIKSAREMRDKRRGSKSTQASCQPNSTSSTSQNYKSLFPEDCKT